MRLREAAVALCVSFVGCRQTNPCRPAADKSVVACVDADAVKRGEAQEYLREPQWVAGSATLQDPRPVAVDKAIRLHLFAAEAKRRHVALPIGVPASPAALSQALLADEAKKRGITRDAIGDDDARKFYDDHPEAFGQIDEVKMQAIIVTDAKKAEQIFGEARGADEAAFSALVAKYSEDEPSKQKQGEIPVVHAAKGADLELLKLGLSLRRKGAIGGPVKANDGRFYVVRVVDAPVIHLPAFDEQARAKAKNILVFERMELVAAELEARLRKGAVIRTFDDAIAALEPATAKPPAPQ